MKISVKQISVFLAVCTLLSVPSNGTKGNDWLAVASRLEQQSNDTSQTNNQVSVGFLFDVSASMDNFYKKQEISSKVKRHLLDSANTNNEYFIGLITARPTLLLDVTSDHQSVLSTLDSLTKRKKEGTTAFLDTCFLAAEKLARSTHRNRVLIVVSDGVDTVSYRMVDDVASLLKRTGVKFYAIETYRGSEKLADKVARRRLKHLADVSGGKMYFAKNAEELAGACARIAEEIKINRTQ